MTSVKGWHTGRVWLMAISASLRIVVMCFSLFSCSPTLYFQVNNGVVYLDYEDSHHGPLLCSFQ